MLMKYLLNTTIHNLFPTSTVLSIKASGWATLISELVGQDDRQG